MCVHIYVYIYAILGTHFVFRLLLKYLNCWPLCVPQVIFFSYKKWAVFLCWVVAPCWDYEFSCLQGPGRGLQWGKQVRCWTIESWGEYSDPGSTYNSQRQKPSHSSRYLLQSGKYVTSMARSFDFFKKQIFKWVIADLEVGKLI